MSKTFLTIVVSLVCFSSILFGQSVGLVLSGGGAKGFAHIGVIKALEENNIPIDYIAGTSMGAIVGGLYAIGYTPDEMEALLNSDDFRKWSLGNIDPKYKYYYKVKDEQANWVEFPLVKEDGIFKPQLPTNIISPEQMDLRFIQFFEPASAGANYNFNNLMVPFFCVATDVYKNEPVILNSGNLSSAIRASMTFPGYFKPIEIDSVLLFDGGMENNFPTNIMDERFNPDIIIGSKVASNPKKPDADDIYKQLENVFMKSTDYEMPKNGILIEPDVDDYGLLDFNDFDTIYARGYRAAGERIDTIKSIIKRRVEIEQVSQKRFDFKSKYKELIIENIYISGVDQQAVNYILNSILRNRSHLTFYDFEQEYFKLLSDRLIKSVYPRLVYNPATTYFDLYLEIKTKNELSVLLGGNISSNLRNMGFAGLDYVFQKKNVYNLSGNFIVGQFYNSISGKFRMDFPPRNMQGDRALSPFYIDLSATTSTCDFFQITTKWFVDNENPTKILQHDAHFQSNFGRPINSRGLLYAGFSYGQTADTYYHTNLVEKEDEPDETLFDYSSIHTTYEYSTLNNKEYANKGKYVRFQIRYVTGLEQYSPGTTTGVENLQEWDSGHSWFHIQGKYQRYFQTTRQFSIGLHSFFNYTNKKQFNNSVATLLSAYAFNPFPQSKLVLFEKFRAHTYAAIGIVPIIQMNDYFTLRGEFHVFQPYQYIELNEFESTFSRAFPSPNFAVSGAAIYQSPIGPLALTASYFHNEETLFYFQLNFGYILFNKRGLD